ncbi:antiviral reverse transcriptase Drt2 [Psychrobacter faecalis]|uniref:antiviral reverse transcriptase Drt2 n=1 Tax=Psychrobacter faecalis TaxID=180588 RepID=UPI003FD5FCA2
MIELDQNFFKQRQKNRNYLHFDEKPSYTFLYDYVTKPSNIEQHSFYPFISYNIVDEKIKKLNKKVIISSKDRLINYPSHVDSGIYAYYSKSLEIPYESYLAEKSLQDTVLAFRKVEKIIDGNRVSQCNIHFSKNVFDYISQKKDCLVLCYDITKFFDNLDHRILKDNWIRLLATNDLPKDHYKIYRSLTRFASVDKKGLYKELGLSLHSRTLNKRLDRLCSVKEFRDKIRKNGLVTTNKSSRGIPQGSPMSGLLSNIYMMDFDEAVSKHLAEIDGKYFRYCDDMIFIFDKSRKFEVENLVKAEINKLKLPINDKKTQEIEFKNGISNFNSGSISYNNPCKLQYLGLLFDGENTYLRETGLSRYNRKLRKAIRMRTSHYQRLESSQRNGSSMYMRKLHTRFTYIGKRNYIGYVFRVANVHDSNNVKRQVKGHYRLFNEYLAKKNK